MPPRILEALGTRPAEENPETCAVCRSDDDELVGGSGGKGHTGRYSEANLMNIQRLSQSVAICTQHSMKARGPQLFGSAATGHHSRSCVRRFCRTCSRLRMCVVVRARHRRE